MRKKNGWGYTMMLILMGILLLFGLIGLYYIYELYGSGVIK